MCGEINCYWLAGCPERFQFVYLLQQLTVSRVGKYWAQVVSLIRSSLSPDTDKMTVYIGLELDGVFGLEVLHTNRRYVRWGSSCWAGWRQKPHTLNVYSSSGGVRMGIVRVGRLFCE